MNQTDTDSLLQLADLIVEYHEGRLNPQQAADLEARLAADTSLMLLFDSFSEKNKMLTDLKAMNDFDTELSLDMLHKKHAAPKTIKLWPQPAPNRIRDIAVAAAAVAAIAFGIWFYTSRYTDTSRHLDDRRDLLNYANDITPGKNTATLTLSNGKTIQLSDAKKGIVVGDDLRYNDNTAVAANSRDLSILRDDGKTVGLMATTPRGGTYEFVLEDGTRVWLNADSKLEFYSSYKNKPQRIVKLEGEGYFEVAKDKTKPFIVESSGQKVEVLGTHFNVNCYANEPEVRTTLVEGSVKVSDGKSASILKPNQQSVLNERGLDVKHVNAEDEISWKDGVFLFQDETLASIMRRVSRWYNVEVVFADDVDRNQLFGGGVSRYNNVSAVLEMLESTKGIHFKIEGRRILVMK